MSIKNEYQQHNFLSNTGFGTVSPTEKLDVVGNIKLTGDLIVNSVRGINATTGSDSLTLMDFNFPDVSTQSARVRVFRDTNTTGNKSIDLHRGNGSVDLSASIGVDGANSYFQIHGGNLGIGTATPINKLDVYSNDPTNRTALRLITEQSPSGFGDSLNGCKIALSTRQNNGTLRPLAFIEGVDDKPDDSVEAGLRFSTFNNGTETERMRIRWNGNVGIGTAIPVAKLDIIGSTEALYVDSKNTTGSYIRLHNNGSGSNVGSAIHRFGSAFAVTNAYGPNILNISNWGADMTFLIDSAQNYRFHNDSSEIVRITGGGNVGIGTATPAQRLHVYTTSNPGSNGAQVHYGDGTYGLFISNGTSAGFSPVIKGVGNDTNDSGLQFIGALTNDTTANIGILMDARTSANAAIANAKVLQLNNYTTNLITVNANGNVGIGTTSPTEKLHLWGGNNTKIKVSSSDTTLGSSSIAFHANDGLGATDFHAGSITSISQSTDAECRLDFSIGSSNTLITSMKGNGNVGIGTINPVTTLQVATPSASTNTAGNIRFICGNASGQTINISAITGTEAIIDNHITATLTSDTAKTINQASTLRISGPPIAGTNVTLTNTASLYVVGGDIRHNNAVWAAPSGTAPLYSARAWVNFNGITGTSRNGGNVTSITKNGTGDYTINFTTAMPDANYSAVASTNEDGNTSLDSQAGIGVYSYSTSSVSVRVRRNDLDYLDAEFISVSVFR